MPELVILSNNSVVGTNEKEISRLFDRRKAILAEYSHYLAKLRTLVSDGDVRAELEQLKEQYPRAPAPNAATNKRTAIVQPADGTAMQRRQFERELEQLLHLKHSVGSARRSIDEALPAYIRQVEAEYRAYSEHSDRSKPEVADHGQRD